MLFGKDNVKQVSYSPGKLAKKMGMSRPTILKHLKNTGLIKDCLYDDNGWLRVPYDVVMKLAGPDILQTNPEAKRGRRSKKPEHLSNTPPKKKGKPMEGDFNTQAKDLTSTKKGEDSKQYLQLSQALIKSGVTIKDLMEKWQSDQKKIIKGKEENEEETQNNSS